jgi:sugar (pentulose or hexulose) kinase
MQQEVYLIYDIGKTNKKCLVFSSNGNVIDEYMEQFAEITDEDGFPCDDLAKLEEWILGQYELLLKNERYKIIGINFATYGASFVHIDNNGKPLTVLHNYLKPYPKDIQTSFLEKYFKNDASTFALETASPAMGMLNSGLQLYWLKHTQPSVWQNIHYSLHLPQYLHYLFTKKAVADYTSIGCHTGLWDFETNHYQPWIIAEGIDEKLPAINEQIIFNEDNIAIGTGLHDSSSALIPYLQQYKEPFLLISSGTWCINLNPFNQQKLTAFELKNDALNFLQANGKAVKASRIFLGREHDYQAERIAKHFNVPNGFYKSIGIAENANIKNDFVPACMEGSGPKPEKQTTLWNIDIYTTAAEAYTALVHGLINLLKISIDLIDTKEVKHFFIDGGFAANKLFVYFLQQLFPQKEIKAVEFPQATALGAYLHLSALVK